MSSNPPIVNNFIRQIINGDQDTGKHGGPILPDTPRWLWRDYPKAPAAGSR